MRRTRGGASPTRLVAPLFVLLTLACARGNPGRPPAPFVLAAASLADALPEALAAGAGDEALGVVFSFAASSGVARQVLAGAPADLVVVAGSESLGRLERGDRLVSGSAVELLGNQLVVIANRSLVRPPTNVADLAQCEALALADPEAVPAGVHARAWLERLGAWEAIAPRVVPTLDVRAALFAVASGSVPVGIVYATDVRASHDVVVAFRPDSASAPEVVYHAAALVGGPSGAGERLVAALQSPAAAQVFERHGFRVLAAP